MRPKQDPVQQKAHALLQEWGGGFQTERGEGLGYPPAPIEKTVQNARASTTTPERYADDLGRWNVLQTAVGDVSAENTWYGLILWDSYHFGYTDQKCADRLNISLRTWYTRRDAARAAFLRAYCARTGGRCCRRRCLVVTQGVDAAALQN